MQEGFESHEDSLRILRFQQAHGGEESDFLSAEILLTVH